MTKYDEKWAVDMLTKHGWKPVIPNEGHQISKDYTMMAIQLGILEKLDK